MTFVKPIKVKGKIIRIIDKSNYLVHVDELDTDIHTTISGKLLMSFYPHMHVGNEMIIQISPQDETKGRFFRGSLNTFGY